MTCRDRSATAPSPAHVLTMGTDVPQGGGGRFQVHLVADCTGEAGVGLLQGQALSQGPGAGAWTQGPSLLPLPGKVIVPPGHIQVVRGPLGSALQGDVAPVC